MKQPDYADILMVVPCYLGYLWMADKFCKKYLGVSKKNELLFVILSFSGWLFINIVSRRYPAPYILSRMVEHILFIGLVLLLFEKSWEKKILAVSMLMIVMALGANFFVALLSCLALFFLHTVKMIPEPLLSEWEAGGRAAELWSEAGATWDCIMTRFSAMLNFWFWHFCLCLQQGFMCLG